VSTLGALGTYLSTLSIFVKTWRKWYLRTLGQINYGWLKSKSKHVMTWQILLGALKLLRKKQLTTTKKYFRKQTIHLTLFHNPELLANFRLPHISVRIRLYECTPLLPYMWRNDLVDALLTAQNPPAEALFGMCNQIPTNISFLKPPLPFTSIKNRRAM
jgi:hypothetical protein